MAVEIRDPYEVLGVARGAGRDEIQRAYRRLARRHHPDVSSEPGAEERFKEISDAYRVLADPKRRREYDAARRQQRYQGGIDFDLSGGLFRGATGRAKPRENRAEPPRTEAQPPRTKAEAPRTTARPPAAEAEPPRAGRGQPRGADTKAELTIGVEVAYAGGRRSVTLPGPAGRPRLYNVDVPAGMIDGERLRLPGQGAPGPDGGAPGDLYLVVRLAPHPRFKVAGRDVMVEVPLSPWEAALGAVVPVGTPAGDLRLDVPAGSSSGRRLRLRGQGLPNPHGAAGDLFAEVRIVVPDRLTPGEEALYRRLATESPFDARSK